MAVSIEIRPDAESDRKLREAFARLAAAGRDQRRVLGRIGLYVRSRAQQRIRQRPRDWGPPTGRLSKSLAMVVSASAVRVGSNLVYAAIQQMGGVVRPKRGKFLAIPVDPTLKRRGVWPRDLPSDSMVYAPESDIMLGGKRYFGPALVRAEAVTAPGRLKKDGTRGKDRVIRKKGEVMFALVRRVTIKGRPYLMFDSEAQAFAFSEIEKELARATKVR